MTNIIPWSKNELKKNNIKNHIKEIEKKTEAVNIGLNDEDLNVLIQQITKEAKNIMKAVTIKMKQTIKQTGEEKSKYC